MTDLQRLPPPAPPGRGIQAANLAPALEIGHQGFGRIACSAAAREGISAFLERRRPVFDK